ncbi:IucA/IucC family protein [Actinoalloteichus caeruleus]|uniref:IucA/IucC family protein n=1 Tax=Actinoalloteichus cyanogriseus TaxID=2893586 RepID=UPI003BB9152A
MARRTTEGTTAGSARPAPAADPAEPGSGSAGRSTPGVRGTRTPDRDAPSPPGGAEGTSSAAPEDATRRDGPPVPRDDRHPSPPTRTALRAAAWSRASRALLAKLIGELSFEDLLRPARQEDGDHLLELPTATYLFSADRTDFGGWSVCPGSIRRRATGLLGDRLTQPAEDVQQFLLDVAPVIGMPPATLANYLSELTATLTADVELATTALPARTLATLGHAEVEGHLTGHPWLVANKGRVGFAASDLAAYAPEARTPLRLPWLAVQRGLAEFRGTPDLSEDGVVASELDQDTRERFASVLRDAGLVPGTHVWFPVHPWQLDHVVRTLWAPELATGRIVELGTAPDRYLPTQSIRTMSNVDRPDRLQVKLPLRILNTAVWRGIPPHCTVAAPAVTRWLRGLWAADERFAGWGATLLGEVASVTVRHPRLSAAGEVPYTWLETLGCVWREPVDPLLGPDQGCWPLAAVLHVDPHGGDLVGAYLEAGDHDVDAWVAALLRVLLRPLLHLLYRYGITVNPHGENVLITTDARGLPTGAVLKDLIDDVNVSLDAVPERGPEPDSHDRVLPRKPWPVLRQYLVDALLVGVLRPLAVLLEERHGLARPRLWGRVRGEIDAYRRRFPELADRIEAGSLTVPEFPRYPLNGDRLVQTGYAELPYRHAIRPRGAVPSPLRDVPPLPPPDGW